MYSIIAILIVFSVFLFCRNSFKERGQRLVILLKREAGKKKYIYECL